MSGFGFDEDDKPKLIKVYSIMKRIEFKFWLFIFIDGDNADVLLGSLDSAFLFSYAFGMYLM